MPRRPRWFLGELLQWARWGYGEERVPDLLRPQGLTWPRGGARETEEAAGSLAAHYGRRVVHQALAGAALAGGAATPAWVFEWCAARIDLGELGLDFGWEEARSLRWTTAPLALAAEGAAHLAWCLVGAASGAIRVPPLPLWWERVADPEAREAVHRVLELLEARGAPGPVVWPLLADTVSTRLRGASLGLPLYLAAWGAGRALDVDGLLATGALDGRGRILPAALWDLKARLAAASGFSGMICPAFGGRAPAGPRGLEILEVADLDQAEFLWETFSPGCGPLLLDQRRCLDDPAWMAANVHRLRTEVLRWKDSGARFARTLGAVLESGDLARRWLRNVEHMMNQPETSIDALKRILDPVSPALVRGLAARSPRSAFRLAQVQVSFYNHRGHIEGSRRWSELGEGLLPALRVHEEALSLEEVALNRRFILERHNRYDFRPELPPEIRDLLDELTERCEARRRREPRSVSPALGGLLGTVTQNFGFCGPAYLSETLHAAARARQAFGDGTVPDLREDWRRQLCYETYALLDARRLEDAEEVLTRYLGSPPLALDGERLGRLGPYEHALLARFLAETAAPAGGDWLRWARCRCRAPASGHPWQLWLLNAGFLTPDLAEKERCWVRAAACCLALDETARVMALMPLGELWSAGLGAEDRIREQTLAVIGTLESSPLNLDHFRELLDAPDWSSALETARHSRDRLFPFSYR